MATTDARAFVLMGVAGSGKTAVGTRAAQRLVWVFLDADDFHPKSNVEKMRHGIPLTDEDRKPWLERLHEELRSRLAAGASLILACSALKDSYRSLLHQGLSAIEFVYLKVDYDTVLDRLRHRQAHFFPKELLDSQFATLESPMDAIVVNANLPLDDVVQQVVTAAQRG
jgi:carbohydrate kinase (thermoresistant glucokinase family)